MFDGTIHRGDYPLLLDMMKQDGLVYTLTFGGIEWSIASIAEHGNYKVLPSAIRKTWGISQSTWRKFTDWLVEVRA